MLNEENLSHKLRPCAISNTRWWEKWLVVQKCFCYPCKSPSKNIPEVIWSWSVATTDFTKLSPFVIFVIRVACKVVVYFFSCNKWSSLWFTLVQSISSLLRDKWAKDVITINQQIWYLCGEYAPMSLFINKEPDVEKKDIVNHLQPHEHMASFPWNRHGATFGKSTFPALSNSAILGSLLRPSSWHSLRYEHWHIFLKWACCGVE